MPADSEKSFDNFDFVDFAQEFLRRNTDYQAQFVSLCEGPVPDIESPDFKKMARSWGLEFRLSARIQFLRKPSNLAPL